MSKALSDAKEILETKLPHKKQRIAEYGIEPDISSNEERYGYFVRLAAAALRSAQDELIATHQQALIQIVAQIRSHQRANRDVNKYLNVNLFTGLHGVAWGKHYGTFGERNQNGNNEIWFRYNDGRAQILVGATEAWSMVKQAYGIDSQES